jgi:glycosyltransferase involved in cell wall biosynthesis
MIDVSVLITCYNKEEYLDECVSSVLRQTKQPREIIVVHDECTNPMHHAAATTIMLPKNLGVARARHEAFRFSTGKLIVFLDGDDILSPDYLEKMTLKIADGADIAFPDIYLFGDGTSKLTMLTEKVEPALVEKIEKLPIPVTSMMKREVYEKLQGFGKWEVLEDIDFWLRAMCNGYTFARAETLLWYRHTPAGRNATDVGKRTRIMREILEQFVIKDNTITQKNG